MLVTAASITTIVLLVVAGLGLSSWFNYRDAEQKLVQADHNLGLALMEKANQAATENDHNASTLYMLHALNKLDLDKASKMLPDIRGRLISNKPFEITVAQTIAGEKDVTCLAISPDGRLIASGSQDGSVSLWSAWSGKLKVSFSKHKGKVQNLLFSPDGANMVSASNDDHTVQVWNVKTGKEQALFSNYDGGGIAFASDGASIAVASNELLTIWKPKSGEKKVVYHGFIKIRGVLFSPDHKILAISLGDYSVRLLSLESGKELYHLEGASYLNPAMAFSSDGRRLAVGSWKGEVTLWNMETGESMATLSGVHGVITGVFFDPNGKRLIASGTDGEIHLWDIKSGKEISALNAYAGAVRGAAISPDGNAMVSYHKDNVIRIWDLKTLLGHVVLKGYLGTPTSIVYSPTGDSLFAGYSNKRVLMWDVQTGRKIRAFPPVDAGISQVAISPDGNVLVAADGKKKIHFWDVKTGKAIIRLTDADDVAISGISFSPDGKLLASASGDKTIRLWDIASGREMARLTGHNAAVSIVSFSPDGKLLASASEDKTVRLWDVESGREVARLAGHDAAISSISFSPDGKLLASASGDKTIRLWDVKRGREAARLAGHDAAVSSISFSPDGKLLASASEDKTVRLWDVESGKEMVRLSGHHEAVSTVVFSPDGTSIASGSEDKSVRVWDMTRLKQLHGKALARLTGLIEDHFAYRLNGLHLTASIRHENREPIWSLYNPIYWYLNHNSDDPIAQRQLHTIAARNRTKIEKPDDKVCATGFGIPSEAASISWQYNNGADARDSAVIVAVIDALRNLGEERFGAYVKSKTLVQNHEIVSDMMMTTYEGWFGELYLRSSTLVKDMAVESDLIQMRFGHRGGRVSILVKDAVLQSILGAVKIAYGTANDSNRARVNFADFSLPALIHTQDDGNMEARICYSAHMDEFLLP